MRYRLPGAVQCLWNSCRSVRSETDLEDFSIRFLRPKFAAAVLWVECREHSSRAVIVRFRFLASTQAAAAPAAEGSLWILACAVLAFTVLIATTNAAKAGGSVAEGEKVFQRCASCHVIIGSDPTRKGPTLQGIIGRPVASVPGFDYSPSMAVLGSRGGVWDEETLDKFLRYPSEFIKGTKMTAPPVRRESERADLLAYLNTLK